ncbi:hypothetical protein PVAP13_1KG058139 [Panicum virgatum]|uniref:Uncharacterized protein n=1 Tax=Panicum virgatum TaxID=38727 RepID=A0A8T0X3F4_PANVG|nr:hypothetical protein PVAP13_1KG058139 [Panicum virgatum]
MLSGIVPLKLFSIRSMVFRLGKLEKLTSVSPPLKLLLLKSMVMRLVQLLKVDGSSPDMLLWSKWIVISFLSSPIADGILPLNIFPPRLRVARFFSLLMPLSVPSSWLS